MRFENCCVFILSNRIVCLKKQQQMQSNIPFINLQMSPNARKRGKENLFPWTLQFVCFWVKNGLNQKGAQLASWKKRRWPPTQNCTKSRVPLFSFSHFTLFVQVEKVIYKTCQILCIQAASNSMGPYAWSESLQATKMHMNKLCCTCTLGQKIR